MFTHLAVEEIPVKGSSNLQHVVNICKVSDGTPTTPPGTRVKNQMQNLLLGWPKS